MHSPAMILNRLAVSDRRFIVHMSYGIFRDLVGKIKKLFSPSFVMAARKLVVQKVKWNLIENDSLLLDINLNYNQTICVISKNYLV